MARKNKPLEVGDLVELRASNKSLQKFERLGNAIGIILEIYEGQLKKMPRKMARVHWIREKGKVEMKLYLHRLKRVT